MLYELTTLRRPTRSPTEISTRVQAASAPSLIKEFVYACTDKSPRYRPSFDRIFIKLEVCEESVAGFTVDRKNAAVEKENAECHDQPNILQSSFLETRGQEGVKSMDENRYKQSKSFFGGAFSIGNGPSMKSSGSDNYSFLARSLRSTKTFEYRRKKVITAAVLTVLALLILIIVVVVSSKAANSTNNINGSANLGNSGAGGTNILSTTAGSYTTLYYFSATSPPNAIITTTTSTTSGATGLASTTPTATTSNAPASCTPTYAVVIGDTCVKIGSFYGVSSTVIISDNPGLDCTNLQLGQIICVPVASPITITASPQCTSSHTVQSSDGCSMIGTLFGVPRSVIIANNPNVDAACDNIFPGQVLCVPIGVTLNSTNMITSTSSSASSSLISFTSSSSSCTPTYTVKKGDGCWSIGQLYGVTDKQIIEYNSLHIDAGCDNLSIGEILCVPITNPTGTLTSTTTSLSSPCAFYYTVLPGDYCWGIAKTYGVDGNTLVKLNPKCGWSATGRFHLYSACMMIQKLQIKKFKILIEGKNKSAHKERITILKLFYCLSFMQMIGSVIN